jgi:hypothetical protein
MSRYLECVAKYPYTNQLCLLCLSHCGCRICVHVHLPTNQHRHQRDQARHRCRKGRSGEHYRCCWRRYTRNIAMGGDAAEEEELKWTTIFCLGMTFASYSADHS